MIPQPQLDQRVSDVYGEKFGWRMFDANFLTAEMRDFLSSEICAFRALVSSRQNLSTVVEVGCGYGRYLDTVVWLEKSYIGLDLISWLIELGKRIHNTTKQAKPRFFSSSVLDLDRVLAELSYSQENIQRTAVFFPFNCLGNIPYLKDVLSRLSCMGVDIIATFFDNSETTTQIREDYYTKCGLKKPVTTKIPDTGISISSAEGFDSIAFDFPYIQSMMEDFGWILEEKIGLHSIGQMAYFKAGGRQNKTYKTLAPMRIASGLHKAVDINQVNLTPSQKPLRIYSISSVNGSEVVKCNDTALLSFFCTPVSTHNWKEELLSLSSSRGICVLETLEQTCDESIFIPINR